MAGPVPVMRTPSGQRARERGIARFVPAVVWLRRYERRWLRGDLIAALTIWALVVPQAIAYAQIAGLPPQAGLFATFAGLLGYALFGSSRQVVVSPTSSTAAISASIVASIVATGDPKRFAALSALLAIMVGIVLIVLGLLRMGFVSRFIAAAVQAGYMFGLGLTIMVGQLPKTLGVSQGGGEFFPQLGHVLAHLGDANGWTALLGFGSLAVLLVLRRVAPVVPGALLVVVIGLIVVGVFHLDHHGVAVLGKINGALPVPAIPAIHVKDVGALLPGALAIAVIGYAETMTVAESMADEHGYDVRPDRELTGTGVANILSGLFKGFITGGGASQSAANDRAGAQSQLVSLIVSGLTVLTAALLLPVFRDLPDAVLGAIVISAVVSFLNVPALRRIARLRPSGFVVSLLAMFGVLVLGVLPGLLLAVGVSIVMLLGRMARPTSSELGRLAETDTYVSLENVPDAVVPPGVLIFRLNMPLLFVNAKLLRDQIREHVRGADPPIRVVVLDLTFSPGLDVEAVNVLGKLLTELRGHGIALHLADVRGHVQQMLLRSGLADEIGRSNIHRTVSDAVADTPAGSAP